MGSAPSSPQQDWPDDLPCVVNADGKRLHEKIWAPGSGDPKAIVFVSHGLAEHVMCYDNMANALVEEGYLVVGHDHVGHGRSEGERVDCEDFHWYVRDVLQHVKIIKERYGEIPIFNFGHSMGGTIALLALLEEPDLFRGTIVSAPFVITFDNEAPAYKRFLIRCVAKIAPQRELSSARPSKLILLGQGRDPEVVKATLEDPLMWQGDMKARWAVCIFDASANLLSQLGDITGPVLVLHGSGDKLVNCEGAKLLHEKAQSKDKTLKIYDGYTHHLVREPEEFSSVVMKDMTEWLGAHL
eukprot:m.11107 g.11107  ORF g.11107 m.11107 type:complete len:298 (+) comp22978_c0_seq2:162-1055(+)